MPPEQNQTPVQSRKNNSKILIIIGALILITYLIVTQIHFVIGGEVACVPWSYTVHNKRDPIVVEAKNAILANTNISEPYFNEHFTFACARKATLPDGQIDKNVFFIYTIGEYSTRVSIYNISSYNSAGNVPLNYGGLSEIKNVISRSDAEKKLETCMGEPTETLVQLRGGGLYMQGINTEWIGNLNLETGECSKSMPFRD